MLNSSPSSSTSDSSFDDWHKVAAATSDSSTQPSISDPVSPMDAFKAEPDKPSAETASPLPPAHVAISTLDGQEHRVETWHLLSHSGVLRNLLFYKPNVPTIVLPDFAFCRSKTLLLFLKLVKTGTLPCTDRTSLVNLAKFIKHFDCAPTQKMLLTHLRDRLHEGWAYHLTTFACAAVLNCVDTCVAALQAPVRCWQEVPHVAYSTAGTLGKNMLRPAHWPLEAFYEVPTPFFVALIRAYSEYDKPPPKDQKDAPETEALPRLFRRKIGSVISTDAEEHDAENPPALRPVLSRKSSRGLITDDPEWTEGDVELISSDNVRFRIPTYVLSQSCAMRDLFQLDPEQDRTIAFLDPEFELAMVLRLFFKFVTQGDLRDADLDEFTISLTHFARFLVKWDCAVARIHFLTWLRDEVRSPHKVRRVGPLTTFKVGAILGCHKTCAAALDSPIGAIKSPHDPYPTVEYNILDPSRWSIDNLVDVPVEYHWALQRAFNRHRCQFIMVGSTRRITSLGVLFTTYMRQAPRGFTTTSDKRM
ncbi:hypothetical protein CC85DRAFT_290088 [Cutaneotrichosporon oleaginosum]|uniref:BTB domain-containing protein n=1 Tax=Cutaneotrichosporon oleaginosum TaxID=879819 RepID=A0A0J0XY97_9TREE|nr:uncharacterized protein CC85DRAFT_290088 [Cutaneotrichosporon oleaginosum]KLT46006.1 hypothetical protein CC85DRAFT_290088 [Cutaneotrichosporon oleaginosum]TXT06700.1 hypothetical protein COLE_06031 [Cutaneotrichosporon oleaginosum]